MAVLAGAAAGIGLLLALVCAQPAVASESPLIAVASSMQFAMREIAQSFERDSGVALRITPGSSGKLLRQIESGAPFEIYVSADDSLTQKMAASPRARPPSVALGRGRFAVFAAHESPLQPDARLSGLASALADGRVTRFAIANPAHAPYGQRAREVLRAAGLWSRIEDKLVFGENVAQAAQFALSGAAQGGIVAHSLLVTDNTAGQGRYALLPESWHQPILHSMVLLENADRTTMKFFRYLQSPKAQRILSQFGYSPLH